MDYILGVIMCDFGLLFLTPVRGVQEYVGIVLASTGVSIMILAIHRSIK